jgi:hypothetical protein
VDVINWLSKYWPAFLLLIAGIIACIATFVITKRDQKQRDNIEALGTENNKLSIEIKKLGDLNNKIAQKVEDIATENSKTSKDNLELSKQSKDLISEVQSLTSQSKILIDKINSRAEYESEENAITGELLFKVPKFEDNDIVLITIGGMTAGNPLRFWKAGAVPVLIGGKNPFNIQVEDNKIVFSLNVYDIDGNLIAEIDKNNWRPNKNFTGKSNYNDTSFEVIDNKGRVAINIEYSGKMILIKGIFPFINDGVIILAGDTSITFPIHKPGNDEISYNGQRVNYFVALSHAIERANIRPIFTYTGKDWLHKRL